MIRTSPRAPGDKGLMKITNSRLEEIVREEVELALNKRLDEGFLDTMRTMVGKPRGDDRTNFEMGGDGMKFLQHYIADIRDGNYTPSALEGADFAELLDSNMGHALKQAINMGDIEDYWNHHGDALEAEGVTNTITQTIGNLMATAPKWLDKKVALVIDAIGNLAPSGQRASGYEGAPTRSDYSKSMSRR
jgi:hypothetical protein